MNMQIYFLSKVWLLDALVWDAHWMLIGSTWAVTSQTHRVELRFARSAQRRWNVRNNTHFGAAGLFDTSRFKRKPLCKSPISHASCTARTFPHRPLCGSNFNVSAWRRRSSLVAIAPMEAAQRCRGWEHSRCFSQRRLNRGQLTGLRSGEFHSNGNTHTQICPPAHTCFCVFTCLSLSHTHTHKWRQATIKNTVADLPDRPAAICPAGWKEADESRCWCCECPPLQLDITSLCPSWTRRAEDTPRPGPTRILQLVTVRLKHKHTHAYLQQCYFLLLRYTLFFEKKCQFKNANDFWWHQLCVHLHMFP